MVVIWTRLSRIVFLTEHVTFFFLVQHSSTTKLFPAGIIAEFSLQNTFKWGLSNRSNYKLLQKECRTGFLWNSMRNSGQNSRAFLKASSVSDIAVYVLPMLFNQLLRFPHRGNRDDKPVLFTWRVLLEEQTRSRMSEQSESVNYYRKMSKPPWNYYWPTKMIRQMTFHHELLPGYKQKHTTILKKQSNMEVKNSGSEVTAEAIITFMSSSYKTGRRMPYLRLHQLG